MLSIMLDGWSILNEYLEGILVFYVGVIGFGLLASKYIIRNPSDWKMKFLAAFGVGVAVLGLVAYVLAFLSRFWPFLLQPGSYATLFIAGLVLLKELWGIREKKTQTAYAFLGMAALFLLLIIRLAFLKHIILPPYSDSPVHYQIVSRFLHPESSIVSTLSFETLLTNYYHFGFHSVVTWLTTITNYDPADTISLVGQLVLVIAPASLFFLVYVLTNNIIAALFAGLLAAIGWDMPAFAVNWGKFPAVSSLAILPCVFALSKLYFHEPREKHTGLLWLGMLGVGLTLMHSRVVVCTLLVIICFLVTKALTIEPKLSFFQSTRYTLLYLISLWPLLPNLTDFYARTVVVTVLLVLLPFAFQLYPRIALGIFLFTFGIWLVSVTPTFGSGNAKTLLDRQFLKIMLYIPFSVIGGVGFAGLMEQIPRSVVLRRSANIVLLGSLILNFLPNNSVYPDSCCNYFSESDRNAFHWLQEKPPDHILVLIAAFEDDGRMVGTDAGIWLFPLLGLPTNRLPFNLNWNSLEELQSICQMKAKDIYIYMGGRNYSFDNEKLSEEIWTPLIFDSGRTRIYQVACYSNEIGTDNS
jgi:hypothetical protein